MVARDVFAGLHPVVCLVYFVAVLGFGMFFFHPIMLVISFVCAAAYALCLKGARILRWGLVFFLPMIVFTAGMNPLFNHRGVTIIAFLPNGNPVTLESLLYGLAAAGMLVAVVTWFVCVNAVMTSDKLIYLFGRLMPSLSMVFSMSLRFVPLFIIRGKEIYNGQKGMGRKPRPVKVLSILLTRALEEAVETADSMNARGYGLPGRTAFGLFVFTRRDIAALGYIALCAAIVLAGAVPGVIRFRFFPSIIMHEINPAAVLVIAAYILLGAFPVLLNIKEALYWKHIESRN